ncbi:Filamentous Growth Regulator [Elasticomyces elasticus]|nr:Filamentous Growth Regulator [Elasticomyces elasticus]
MSHPPNEKPLPQNSLTDMEAQSPRCDLSSEKGDLLGLEHTDPVLNAKMHLVNNAIDEIGFTGYQAKLFVLNGFGYAVDSLILLIQSIIAGQAALEFRPSYTRGLTIAVYVGMLTGALFWGLSADVIGRKFAFNCSLMICSVFAIIAGSAPNWIVLGLFVCLSAFGGGGNLVLDTAVFLEYLPSKYAWLLTLMAAWWGVGQLIAGLFAWAFIPNYSCADAATCTYSNNKGWRYVWFASGALVFVMSIARITVIRLKETPKFLLGEGKDAEVVETLQFIAHKYNRHCSLTLEQLQACGSTGSWQGSAGLDSYGRRLSTAHAKSRFSFTEVRLHLKGLFATKRLGLSTSLIWFSWLLIGLAYPLYNVFLVSLITYPVHRLKLYTLPRTECSLQCLPMSTAHLPRIPRRIVRRDVRNSLLAQLRHCKSVLHPGTHLGRIHVSE